jgi:hypothetical protein
MDIVIVHTDRLWTSPSKSLRIHNLCLSSYLIRRYRHITCRVKVEYLSNLRANTE